MNLLILVYIVFNDNIFLYPLQEDPDPMKKVPDPAD